MQSSYIVFLDAPSARQLEEAPDAKYTWRKTTSSLGKRTYCLSPVESEDANDDVATFPKRAAKREKLEDDGAEDSNSNAKENRPGSDLSNEKDKTDDEGDGTATSEDPAVSNEHGSRQVERVRTLVLDEDDDEKKSWILSPEKISAASEWLSQMYKNVDLEEVEEEDEEDWDGEEGETDSKILDETRLSSANGTVLSWPSTDPAQNLSAREVEISFLRDHSATQNKRKSRRLSRRQSYSYNHTTFYTQDTTSNVYSYMQSRIINSNSSIMLLPLFHINLHSLESLSTLMVDPLATRPSTAKWSRKVNILVAVLEVEGPELIKIKNGPDAGKEVSMLKLIVGEPSGVNGDGSAAEESLRVGEEATSLGSVCRLTAWRETAEAWAGEKGLDGVAGVSVKRGDVVYVENVLFSRSPQSALGAGPSNRQPIPPHSLTASSRLESRIFVCFRTLPSTRSDKAFRPDLRLGASDPGVRRVADIVRWMENVIDPS